MSPNDRLYQALGRKIREARERTTPKISQEKLAVTLRISRTSIVNIEAGRQHAPLHVLWDIADVLGVELSALVPSRDDLLPLPPTALGNQLTKQIARAADGDKETERDLTGIVSLLKTTIGAPLAGKESS